MAYDYHADTRLDPRLRSLLAHMPDAPTVFVSSREEMVAKAASPVGRAATADYVALLEMADSEEVAPSSGLSTTTREFVSSPDGNTIKVQITRPDSDETLACVYYIHGGAMASSSCFYGNYRAWSRLVAAHGVAVVMVDFRNAVVPSSAPEVVAYPGGLNDCVAGLRWTHQHAHELGIDPARITVAGESGGGNLALALALSLKGQGDLSLVKGLYVMCPYIAGEWPADHLPSSTENNGIFINVHGNAGVVGYGEDAFLSRDPLAWPGFATLDDVAGLPPTVISVNECDPLRDEGVAFYRLLLAAGVSARGRMVLGTAHAAELFIVACPEISHDTARDLAAFALN